MTAAKTYPKADHSHLIDELAEGIQALTTSEAWTRYLKFQAAFHRYSAGNVQLMLMQNPYATQVAGFNTWKSLGRFVRKGEKGMFILAPMVKKVEDEVTGETETEIRGFRWVSVFDVAQTEGDDLPEISSKIHGEDASDFFGQLVEVAKGLGFAVTDHEFEGGANGDCDHGSKIIRVEATNSPAQRVKTLAHELAHAILHAPETTNYRENRALCELEAESVAFVICRNLGIESDDYTFGYVAGWAGGEAAVEIIKGVSERIQKTAHKVLTALETKGE